MKINQDLIPFKVTDVNNPITDCNDLTENGQYFVEGTASNIPVAKYSWHIHVIKYSNYVIQIARRVASSNIMRDTYERQMYNGVWGTWTLRVGRLSPCSNVSDDFNGYKASGIYYWTGNPTGDNKPCGTTGILEVFPYPSGTSYIVQRYTTYTGRGIYLRYYYNNVWHDWVPYAHSTVTLWTPTLQTQEGAAPTVDWTTASGGQGTHKGYYYRIGDMVFIAFYCRGKITALNGTNNYAVITGLPFTIENGNAPSLGMVTLSTGQCYNCLNTDPATINLCIYNNKIYVQSSNGASAQKWKVTPSGQDCIIAGSGWYWIS